MTTHTVNAHGVDPATVDQARAERVAVALGLAGAVIRSGPVGFALVGWLTITKHPVMNASDTVLVPWSLVAGLSLPSSRSVREVFMLLVATMEADNGCYFDLTGEQFERTAPSIRALLDAGFFADDPSDLDGSWWQMAAGEATEAPEFFARCPEAYEVVSGVLNEIFDGDVAIRAPRTSNEAGHG